jgi:methylenetetrahydrofolate dehydrogenase (NADP+)/methenyltetrahydrofolate cyclohydrolase
MLLKGKPIADKIKEEIVSEIKNRKDAGLSTPKIALLRIGENPDDIAYETRIMKNCNDLGILTKVVKEEEDISNDQIIEILEELNDASDIHGIMVFRPLPQHLDMDRISKAVKPEKDIDSMSPVNLAKVFAGDSSALAPCTPEACVEILKYYLKDLSGKNVAIINRSLVLGKPLAMLLLSENATVTVCHSKTENMAEILKRADVVVAGIGKGKFFGPEYFYKDNIVVDVGINFIDGKMCGDVDFESVSQIVKGITPVPGGVGTVTSAILLRNVIKGIRLQEEPKDGK